MNDDIKVTFIIPENCRSEYDCTEDMKLAFIATEQHSNGGLQAQWVQENQFNSFKELTKRDVIVMTEFEGELYAKLHASKCLLVGPRCLSCCLTEGVAIPSGPEPVFTVAMRGLVVTASGLTKQQKENIKKKVHWMGGIYNTVLTDDTTHLVSDTVLSDKYIKSVEKQIPIMSESWITAVWEASLLQNVNGSSPQFDSHKLPPFANLQVTTSALSRKDKQMVMKLVNENGGTFSGAFQSETTDVVVLNKDGVGSEKYKAALEYGKACVLPSWVRESAASGAALPLARYRVAGASTSSPLPASRLPDMSLNFSRITNIRPPNNFIDETRSADVTTMSGRMKNFQSSQETKKSNDTSTIDQEIVTAFENFDMSAIKKAGPIFDGFCIWVHGLTGLARERASQIVSRCGGVRYDAGHERVTHVVAPRAAAHSAARAAPHAPVLTPLWLVASVVAGRPASEAEYVIDTAPQTPAKSARKANPSDAASPMSKRNLQLLRRAPAAFAPPAPLAPPSPAPAREEPQDELVNHYLSQQMPEERVPKEKTPEPEVTLRNEHPDITNDVTEEPTEEIEQIFRGMKIEVLGLDEEAICELSAEVGAAGGVLCARGAGGGHVLVPLDCDTAVAGADCVTVFWLKDCLCQQELLPIQYYHRPVRLAAGSEAPLKGVVASLSTYSGVERAFLDELAKLLGATTQLRFCRRNTANALASTHLICPTPAGDKYLGAVKWGLPAVTARWLLDCAAAGSRLPEREYLVGDTKAPPSPQKSADTTNCEKEIEAPVNNVTDKENEMLPPPGTNVPKRQSIPKEQSNKDNNDDEMSPASRYIAMARRGLLGCSQESPLQTDDTTDRDKHVPAEVRTPILEEGLSKFSPRTRRRLLAMQNGEMPSDPIRTPTDPFCQTSGTPDSGCGFGAVLRPGGRLSPAGRKRLWSVVRNLPSKPDQGEPPRQNTPLSEIRNRFLAQFASDAATTPPSEHHVAPRKLLLQEQAETPPRAKMAKTSVDQSPGSAMLQDLPSQIDTRTNDEEEQKSASSNSSTVPPVVDEQLQRLNAALAARLSSQRSRRTRDRDSLHVPQVQPESEPGPQSQPNTVGWDDSTPISAYQEPLPPAVKRFMLSSNVDNREEIIEMIIHLGGEVSEGVELDLTATHLLCSAPARSEKMMGSVAAGRWVLHPAYIVRSRTHGSFLPEEQFEWGNPTATCLPNISPSELPLARAAHRWREQHGAGAALGAGAGAGPGAGRGPFAGLVALLHAPAPRAQLLRRLVTAGGGIAPDLQPPYTDESITVCFADLKRCPLAPRDADWLKAHKIPVCPPVLLSSYLTDDPPPDPRVHCISEFRT